MRSRRVQARFEKKDKKRNAASTQLGHECKIIERETEVVSSDAIRYA